MSNSSDDDLCNETSRDGDESSPTIASNGASVPAPPPVPDNSSIPKPKRLACMICRKRKLKCDGSRPSCGTCARLGHTCEYDEQRRKSGPKRGYVKALEERLKQVETLLKTQQPGQDGSANNHNSNQTDGATSSHHSLPVGNQIPMSHAAQANQAFAAGMAAAAAAQGDHNTTTNSNNNNNNNNNNNTSSNTSSNMDTAWHMNGSPQPQCATDPSGFNKNFVLPIHPHAGSGTFTWEMIGLGLEEPLPPQETIDELHQIYFDKVHSTVPMIHKYRYLAAMNLPPAQRPPVCLRYAMWTLACSVTDKYDDLKELFYQRARKYVEADHIKGFGEHMISVAHTQTHILLSSYEMKMMYFPRAWINTGTAIRLGQMIGLHRLDGSGLDVKQCLPPPKDWTEKEERRRTFWMSFCNDRYASVGTGWPMTIDERDILTNLPSSETAFEMSRPEPTLTLAESLVGRGCSKVSVFGGVILLSCLYGRNLLHLHRPETEELDRDTDGPFWNRHREMDNTLLNISLNLPSELKLPTGITNPNVIFLNMNLHTSTICLHQAAIFKAEKHNMPASVSAESKMRCISAANEIASIMRTISHMDLRMVNHFTAFCLYVSARVFIQYLKNRPDDSRTADSLRFLLQAMDALKKRNPLTESFLVQLDIDFEALAAKMPSLRNIFPRSGWTNAEEGFCNMAEQNGESAAAKKYKNECHFLKTVGDNGNAAEAPSLLDSPGDNRGQANQGGNAMSTTPSWLDDPNMNLTPPSANGGGGTATATGGGSGPGVGGFSTTESEQSNNGPTPNSSTNGCDTDPRPRGGIMPRNLSSGQVSSSFQNPFSPHAQPIQMHGLLQVGMDMNGINSGGGGGGGGGDSSSGSAGGPTGANSGGGGGFFGDVSGFSLPTSLDGNSHQNDFTMSGDWGTGAGGQVLDGQMGGMDGTTDEGRDGILRVLMGLGGLEDSMDLGSWNHGDGGGGGGG